MNYSLGSIGRNERCGTCRYPEVLEVGQNGRQAYLKSSTFNFLLFFLFLILLFLPSYSFFLPDYLLVSALPRDVYRYQQLEIFTLDSLIKISKLCYQLGTTTNRKSVKKHDTFLPYMAIYYSLYRLYYICIRII